MRERSSKAIGKPAAIAVPLLLSRRRRALLVKKPTRSLLAKLDSALTANLVVFLHQEADPGQTIKATFADKLDSWPISSRLPPELK
jgi:hypothetical protein